MSSFFFSSCLGLNLVFPPCFVFYSLLITGAGVLLVSFLSNAGAPGEMWSLPNLRSPWQRGLSLCCLRNGLTVEQTVLLGTLSLLHGKSTAENLP